MSKYKVVNSPRSQVTQGELLERDGSAYILPPASESEMGGVRVGQRLYMVGNILNAVDQRYDDTALALAVADNAADIQDLADALMPDLSGYATDAELTAGDVATLAAAKDYADEQVPDLSGYATLAGAVPKSLIDAKGDLLVGTANDTLSRLPVGPNGSLLMADSNSATGLSYQSPAPLLVNLLSNSDFSNGTTGWFGTGGSLTNEGNTLILTAADAVTQGYVTNNTTILAGHQYYVSVRFTPFRTHNLLISLGGDYQGSPNPASAGIATQVSATITALEAGVSVAFYSNAGLTTGQTTGARVGFDNAVCIDLTAAFGAGNEPAKSEMDLLLSKYPNSWFNGTVNNLVKDFDKWNRRGTGSPVGVVTAAPGVKWTDTANTNGASEWIKKTGTGSTGWVVTVGDTGLRTISTLIGGVGVLATSTAQLRRVGSLVELRVDLKTDATYMPGTAFLTIPLGFVENMPTYLAGGYSSAIFYYSTGLKSAHNGSTVGNRGHWTWITSGAWPTTLPGTA